MNQYRKRPVVVFAHQWRKNGDHPGDYAKPVEGFEKNPDNDVMSLVTYSPQHQLLNDWEGQVVRRFRHPDIPGERPCEVCGQPHQVHGWIDTLEAGHRVCPGDYVITGVRGERYPCKEDIFLETYEAVTP